MKLDMVVDMSVIAVAGSDFEDNLWIRSVGVSSKEIPVSVMEVIAK